MYKTGRWGEQEKVRSKKRLSYFTLYQNNLRQSVLDKFGGICNKCGFDDPRALQIDHVNGDGRLDLRNQTGAKRYRYLKRVLLDTENRYQLLCANCNWIKRSENNETVHREAVN